MSMNTILYNTFTTNYMQEDITNNTINNNSLWSTKINAHKFHAFNFQAVWSYLLSDYQVQRADNSLFWLYKCITQAKLMS